ncbi:MAG: DNA repair protein RecN, partial [Fimbriimonadaceae bacterium]|nr:DNA repair protein RecN [Alphaproteobacteria bacterium]
ALKAKFETDLAEIDAGAGALVRLRENLARLEDRYQKSAATLSRRRAQAGLALSGEIQSELAPLRLERARFEVNIEALAEGGALGLEKIEFWVQTNPGTAAGPLMKIASGGELSRFLLALKVVLADKGSAPTLIFDEVDAAIGGAVADAVGQRLARLADNVQVLAVTHAPQVAARAQGHFLIAKQATASDLVQTQVTSLQNDERREELARMLAGAEVTEEARAAADRLMG